MTNAKSGQNRYGGLDALRAYAMTFVIAQHCDLIPFGWIGVWVFFVISGFVVTSSIVDGRDHDEPAFTRIKSFYKRRVARIMPLYFCYIALFLVVALLSWRAISWQALLTLVTFTYNFYPEHSDAVFPVSHLWTISVEMQFYLVAGFVLIACTKPVVTKILYAFLIVPIVARVLFSIVARHYGFSDSYVQNMEYHISFFHFDAFAAGCLLAYNRWFITRRNANLVLLGGVAIMAEFLIFYSQINGMTLGLHGLASFKRILSGQAVGQWREALVFAPVLALSLGLVLSSLVETSWLRALFQRDWIAYIGRCSYSGYMIHFAVIWALRNIGLSIGISDIGGRSSTIIVTRIVLFLLSTIITAGLSIVLFRTLEQPLAAVAKRWMKPRAVQTTRTRLRESV